MTAEAEPSGMEMLPGCDRTLEDLKRRRLLNELDDVVALNGVNGRSDTCRHVDEWSIFDHYTLKGQKIENMFS